MNGIFRRLSGRFALPVPGTSAAPRPIRNVLANWSAFLFGAVASFFVAPYVVHHLGDTAYGAWVLLGSMVGYLGLLDLGVRGAIMRFVSRLHAANEHEEAGRVASSGLFIFGISSIVAILAGTALAFLLDRLFDIPAALLPQARIAVVLSSLTIATSLITGVYGGIVTAMQRFDLVSLAELSIEIVRISAVVMTLRLGLGIVALAAIQLGCGLIRLVVSYFLSRRLYPELDVVASRWSRAHLRQILGFSLASTALHSAAVVILQLDALVVGTFLPVAMVTYFSIAGTLAYYGKSVVDGISTTVTPRVSALEGAGDMEGARLTALLGAKIASLVHLPIVVTFLLRGGTFIGLWMGHAYAERSGRVLAILSLSYWLIAGRQTMVSTMMGLSRHRAVVPAAWIEALLNAALSIALVRSYGITGVAWGTTIPYLLMTVTVYPALFSRALGTSVAETWREVWLRPSIAVLPFALATYAVDRWVRTTSLVAFFAQVAAVLVFAVAGAWWFALDDRERRAVAERLPIRLRLPLMRSS